MELELAVEKELITQEEIDIVMDIKVYKVKKRELTKKYKQEIKRIVDFLNDKYIKKN